MCKTIKTCISRNKKLVALRIKKDRATLEELAPVNPDLPAKGQLPESPSS